MPEHQPQIGRQQERGLQDNGGGLTALITNASAERRGPAPVHLWNPPFCGDIDMRIAANGQWFYNGSPIGRPALVRLFANILRKDPERYVLVTPLECVGIRVDDAPFVGVELLRETDEGSQSIRLRTNVDDWVAISGACPLRCETLPDGGIKPYVRIRGDLWALLSRACLFELVALGQTRLVDGIEHFGIESCGVFFPISGADDWADDV